MKKLILQILITFFIFFVTWYGLMQINWIKIFKIEQITVNTEQKLGDLFWEVYKKSGKEINKTEIINSVDSILVHICEANKIERSKFKVHILEKDDINAFALPDGHLVLYSGLILNSKNQEELAGVICHEIAHIELNHIMNKLVKEIGLSVLISMSTGNTGAEIIKKTAQMLSSTAFDRSLEKEADIKAVDYLVKANINPKPFAEFLYRVLDKNHESGKYLKWVSTHPDSKERAEYIIEYSLTKY